MPAVAIAGKRYLIGNRYGMTGYKVIYAPLGKPD
jgi:hypothetical protein